MLKTLQLPINTLVCASILTSTAVVFAQAGAAPAPAATEPAKSEVPAEPAAPAPADAQPTSASAAATVDAPVDAPAADTTAAAIAPAAAEPVAPSPTTAGTPDVNATPAPLPQKLAVGKQGTFQPSALLQGWWQLIDNTKTSSSFRIRRAELKIKGTIIPDAVDYALMIDPAKTLKFGSQTVRVQNQEPAPMNAATPEQVSVLAAPTDTSILQDFYVTFISEYSDVTIGQFKIPLSWEGYNSSSQLILPERALVSRTFGDRRDLGLRAEKKFGAFGYLLTLTNGTGVNRLDDNNDKDVALRLEGRPVEPLMIGIVGSSSVGSRKDASTKDRVEADVRAEVSNFVAQAEYIHGWDGVGATRKEGHGAYAAFAYTLAERFQPVLRAGLLDPDLDVSKNTTWHYEAGLNYLVQKNEMKLQASFSVHDPEGSAKAERQAIVSAQAQF
ncbi:MAG: porin [Polyangiaceae bacterium]|nr:porin [Polyangiaceae bacterium]